MITINGKYAEDMKDVYEKWLSASDFDKKTHNVVSLRTRYLPDMKPIQDYFTTFNIVTDSGDLYYAQRAVVGSITEDYSSASNRAELQNPVSADTPAKSDTYSSVTTPITASRKAITATYPKVNDLDADNTGAGTDIATWLYEWTTGDFDTGGGDDVTGGCIHNAGVSPVGGSDLLTHWNYGSPFEKLSTDTLKTFVNHEFRGV